MERLEREEVKEDQQDTGRGDQVRGLALGSSLVPGDDGDSSHK